VEGAKKSSFGDEHSVVDPAETRFDREDRPLGVSLRFRVTQGPFRLIAPWVDDKLAGVFPTVGQTIEDAHGHAIRVDTDLLGQKRATPIAGPLADLKPGENVLHWSVKREYKNR
jgi:hypothetical protein